MARSKSAGQQLLERIESCRYYDTQLVNHAANGSLARSMAARAKTCTSRQRRQSHRNQKWHGFFPRAAQAQQTSCCSVTPVDSKKRMMKKQHANHSFSTRRNVNYSKDDFDYKMKGPRGIFRRRRLVYAICISNASRARDGRNLIRDYRCCSTSAGARASPNSRGRSGPAAACSSTAFSCRTPLPLPEGL